jgi:hypothetical protein
VLPVIVGGLIGISGGLSGTFLSSWLRAKDDRRNVHREKLETTVTYLAELENWGTRLRHQYLFDLAQETYEPNPAAKILALTAIHFPSLHALAEDLDAAADKYELALMAKKQQMLEAGTQAMKRAADALVAANPADPTIVERMKLAATEAKIAAVEDTEVIHDAYAAVLVQRKTLLTEAQKLAANL